MNDKGYENLWIKPTGDCKVKSCSLTVWDGATCTSTDLPANTLWLDNGSDPWKVKMTAATVGGYGPLLVCYKCIYGGKDPLDTQSYSVELQNWSVTLLDCTVLPTL